MKDRETHVEVYVTEKGRKPFVEWLQGLKDARARAIIRTRINRVRLGNFGDARPVGEGVFELRIDHGPGYRIYFGTAGSRVAVLLFGGDKGSQERDIHRAKRYWRHYQE